MVLAMRFFSLILMSGLTANFSMALAAEEVIQINPWVQKSAPISARAVDKVFTIRLKDCAKNYRLDFGGMSASCFVQLDTDPDAQVLETFIKNIGTNNYQFDISGFPEGYKITVHHWKKTHWYSLKKNRRYDSSGLEFEKVEPVLRTVLSIPDIQPVTVRAFYSN